MWSTAPLSGLPLRYSRDGRMIGISPDGSAVVELHPDGSTTPLLTGLTQVYDLVVTSGGTIYVSDFPAEQLVELLPNGDSRVVTAIAPDNTNLALSQAGDLYLNNAAVGFNRVNVATGALTPITASRAPCRVIASPAVVEFDSAGRALFFSWVDHLITWADPDSGEGGLVFNPTWANTSAADVGADGDLYVGVSGCGTATPARIMRVTAAGSASVRASAAGIGHVSALAVTDGDGVFVAAGTETAGGLYYAASGDATLRLVPNSAGIDIGSLAAYPSGERVLAYLGADSTVPAGAVRLRDYSAEGPTDQYTVRMP